MNVTGNILAARSCVVSHGRCRVITTTRETARSPPSTATKERRAHPTTIAPSLKSHPPPPRGLAIATSAAAAGACVLCHSVRLTAACSATSAVQRQFHSSSGLPGAAMGVGPSASSSGGAAAAAVGSTASIHSHRRPDGRGVALAPASEGTASKSRSLVGASIHSSAPAAEAFRSPVPASAVGAALLSMPGWDAPTFSGGPPRLSLSLSSSSLWGVLAAGAVVLASVGGGMFLNPIDRLTGGGGNGNGNGGSPGGGGGGGGGGGSNRNDNDQVGGGMFENANAEEGTKEKERGEAMVVEVTAAPRPYEVSVRALRGGRLSMEDEFVVVGGGRLSAVFDGHGGGGVSQYLRDHLHIIIADQLHYQTKQHAASKNFRSDLKSFVFGKGFKGSSTNDGTHADATKPQEHHPRASDAQETNHFNPTTTHERNYSATHTTISGIKRDLSNIGLLPVATVATALKDSFDQIDRQILQNDEFEYQGSTAIAVLLHETPDGVRTLLSANIGDSRGILSRDGRAVDLSRDHKPNDDREKARILAMGEKIEWDHYCKVHRVRNLSLSRAIGDRFAKPAVSGEVEIQRFPVDERRDEFVLLASDGLWDVMTSQEVVSYVHKRLNAAPKDGADVTCEEDWKCLRSLRRKNMSRFIANEALRRGSGDNISVVIVWLKDCDGVASSS
eukprot:CAMPEP_0171391108 /NCGR_PEP_ID=MMETSP0880-20121228/1025_1 /TAXON_ID=67004 /ORGANISM="Thalassiosira weissflogii, Strain CCMP1336" /LENGTH=672 /DNA_ID=CAMNT_0011903673 /DNA_START=695 /DNA_END=2713 /DNA_ORIENTATION=-